MVTQNATGRFNQYERKLLAVDSKERRRERKRIRRKNRPKRTRRRPREEITSDLDDEDDAEDQEEHEEPIEEKAKKNDAIAAVETHKEKSLPGYIEKSEIYKSIHKN